jgi:hypothetical protein
MTLLAREEMIMTLFRKLVLVILLGVPTLSAAQSTHPDAETTTKLQDFIAQYGVVIIRGFSTIGEVKGLYGTSITIDSKEFTNASTGSIQYGITIEVTETTRVERDHTSYIDYDELESLLNGLDYIGQVDRSATRLDAFQADYRTRGDFQVSVFSSGSKTLVAVQSGSIGSTSAYFKLEKLGEFRDLILQAKMKLDSLQ